MGLWGAVLCDHYGLRLPWPITFILSLVLFHYTVKMLRYSMGIPHPRDVNRLKAGYYEERE